MLFNARRFAGIVHQTKANEDERTDGTKGARGDDQQPSEASGIVVVAG